MLLLKIIMNSFVENKSENYDEKKGKTLHITRKSEIESMCFVVVVVVLSS